MDVQKPLNSSEIKDVLKYWLLALRYEESLTSRPQAHKVAASRDLSIRTEDPQDGQEYFKLPFAEGAQLMLQGCKELELGLNPERAAFCEHCIRAAWKREYMNLRRDRPNIEQEGIWVLGFPVLYLPRHEELVPLLRFPIALHWREEERPWHYPPYPKRRPQNRVKAEISPLKSTPSKIILGTLEETDGLLPYAFDPQLLTRELCVCDEELADFHQALRQKNHLTPGEMIEALCELLESGATTQPEPKEADNPPESKEKSPIEWLSRLQRAIQNRLLSSPYPARAYPLGLVFDDSRVQATVHVQNEIGALLQASPGEAGWFEGSPLWHYLSASPISTGREAFHGRFTQKPLNPEQLQAGEAFLGTRFHALQGPPGTGKTALILNLTAAHLCERIYAYCNGSPMGSDCFLIASTNNRAVDNVLDPLSGDFADGALPLGLRLGNRDITSKLSVHLLERCLQRIEQSDDPEAQERELEEKKAEFLSLYKDLRKHGEPRQQAFRRQSRRASLQAKIFSLKNKLLDARQRGIEPLSADLNLDKIFELTKRISKKIRLLEAHASGSGLSALEGVELQWKRIQRTQKSLKVQLASSDLSLDLPLPPEDEPDIEKQLEAWENACGDAEDAVDAFNDLLHAQKEAKYRSAQLRSYEEELQLLEADLEADRPYIETPLCADEHAELEYALFQQAIRIRDLWAFLHRDQLRNALTAAIESLGTKSSFRRFYEDEPDKTLWILKLFPIFGCTLLSLGNAFPARDGVLARLVIDEAGQCHPAYAISGLMRAHSAMLIGDVHQLEPVIKLALCDEERVQRQAKLTLSQDRLAPYRVYEQCGHSAQSVADLPLPQQDRPTLRAHYRCQPGIIALSEALCSYGLRVMTPAHASPYCSDLLTESFHFIPVRGSQKRVGGSWENPDEISLILKLLEEFKRRGLPWGDLAFITPYVGQCDAIRRALRQNHIPCGEEFWDADPNPLWGTTQGAVTTGTVHRFQGGERSIVVFSTVCTSTRSLGFLNERVHLLNVAVSRAQDHLIVIGHPDILASGRMTRHLLNGKPICWSQSMRTP